MHHSEPPKIRQDINVITTIELKIKSKVVGVKISAINFIIYCSVLLGKIRFNAFLLNLPHFSASVTFSAWGFRQVVEYM